MYKYFLQIVTLLGESKAKTPALVVLFILLSLLDVVGIGLIAPYISLIMGSANDIPEGLQSAIHFVGLSSASYEEIVIITGLLLVSVFIAKAFLAIFVNYKILSFCFNQGAY